MVSEVVYKHLACPACGGRLLRDGGPLRCSACGVNYPPANGQLDLRLRGPKTVTVGFDLGKELPPTGALPFGSIPLNSAAPAIPFDEPKSDDGCFFGNRLTRELLSWFPRAGRPDALMLDLGCGNKRLEPYCRPLGYDYVGIDLQKEADLLADAHALPFVDGTFDFAISFAVLEHLRYPSVTLQEVFRTLRPGAVFIGSVAFLEPYHQNSFYHTTGLGLYSLLTTAGFEVQWIEPNSIWTVLPALVGMNFFPGLPTLLQKLPLLPAEVLHRVLWALRAKFRKCKEPMRLERDRLHFSTGGFRFIARRPGA